MANVDEVRQFQSLDQNAEIEQLAALVQELREECETLRRALAQTESERDGYRKAIHEHARKAREFEDVDVNSLNALSAGPVETMD